MHIPVIILIVITLFGKDSNDDSKWFVFHTAILNLILGIIWEILYLFPYMESELTITLLIFSLNLAVNSTFPLAFTRFFYLYYQNLYEKIFNRKMLFPILVGYDLFMLVLFSLDFLDGDHLRMLFIDFFLLCGNIICSTCVFLKIRNMMKLVDSNSRLSTFSDLRKAAFVCTFQSCTISLHLATTFFVSLFQIYLRFDRRIFDSLFGLYMILAPAQFPLYQLFVIIDTLITLLVLRSYRSALVKVYGKILENIKHIKHFILIRRCKKTRVIHLAQHNNFEEKF
jgi:hypothetical protein